MPTPHPGEVGTFPAGDRYTVRGAAAATGDIPCPGDRTYEVHVSVASTHGSEADLNALYIMARRLLSLRERGARCAQGCDSPHQVELHRRWDFSAGKISMFVADRLYCLRPEDPVPTGISEVKPGTFGKTQGSEGSPSTGPQNTAGLDAGPGLRMPCGPERIFEAVFTYPTPEGCEAITDYDPYIARAEADAKLTLDLLGCPPGCEVKQFRFPWKRWSCRQKAVTVELAAVVRCTRPVPDKNGENKAPGCLPGILARLVGRRDVPG